MVSRPPTARAQRPPLGRLPAALGGTPHSERPRQASLTSASAAAAGFARALPCAATPDMPGPSLAVPVAARAVPGRIGVPAGLLSRRRRGLFRLRLGLLRYRLLRLRRLRLELHLRPERLGLRFLGPLRF